MRWLILAAVSLVLGGCGGAAAVTPGPTSSPVEATASPTSGPCHPTTEAGCLTATPGSGPVGTVVSLDGTGCGYSGQPTAVSFEGWTTYAGHGTEGSADLEPIATDVQGHFHATFQIPGQLHMLQTRGGGATTPGIYAFVSHPPFCEVAFVVTAS